MLEVLEVNTLTRDIYNGVLGLIYTHVTSVLQPDEEAAPWDVMGEKSMIQ